MSALLAMAVATVQPVAPAWREYAVPASADGGSLYSVVATGRDGAWASGATYGEGSGGSGCNDAPYGDGGSVMLRWDGRSWSVPVPAVGGVGHLTALGPDSVWATGNCASLRWDGGGWRATPYAQVPDMQDFVLGGFSIDAPTDGWMVGSTSGSASTGYVERWDGSSWSVVPLPGAGALTSVKALAPDDVWVAGHDGSGDLALWHWDGRNWGRTALPETGRTAAFVQAFLAQGPDDVWAAGTGLINEGGVPVRQTLIMHWDGRTWTTTSTPVPPVSATQNTAGRSSPSPQPRSPCPPPSYRSRRRDPGVMCSRFVSLAGLAAVQPRGTVQGPAGQPAAG